MAEPSVGRRGSRARVRGRLGRNPARAPGGSTGGDRDGAGVQPPSRRAVAPRAVRRGQVAPGDGTVGEVMVSGEGLTRGAPQVFGTLLHEAAHALAREREIRDTSLEGRYHNRTFKRLAEELGLRVGCHERRGWAITELDPECQLAHDDTIATLELAMVAYRDREEPRSQQARRQASCPRCAAADGGSGSPRAFLIAAPSCAAYARSRSYYRRRVCVSSSRGKPGNAAQAGLGEDRREHADAQTVPDRQGRDPGREHGGHDRECLLGRTSSSVLPPSRSACDSVIRGGGRRKVPAEPGQSGQATPFVLVL
jgi:hypothetical protein